jgi:exosome complex RNA-binding protein Csl4
VFILTRRVVKRASIGDDIKVTVLGVNERRVRLTVTAPHPGVYLARPRTAESLFGKHGTVECLRAAYQWSAPPMITLTLRVFRAWRNSHPF